MPSNKFREIATSVTAFRVLSCEGMIPVRRFETMDIVGSEVSVDSWEGIDPDKLLEPKFK